MRIEEKYHDPILAVIKKNGPMGVNAIAKAIDMPLSSVQKYLDRQDYFKKTSDRKWDLPENVTENLVTAIETNRLQLIAQSLNTQSLLVGNSVDLFVSSINDLLKQISNIIPALESYKAPVANDKTVSPLLLKLQETVSQIPLIINKNKRKLSPDYLELLTGVNWLELVINKGSIYFEENVSTEIAELLTEQREELSDEVVEVISQYKD